MIGVHTFLPLFALVILVLHQFFLLFKDAAFTEWIFKAPREIAMTTNLMAFLLANREGVFGVLPLTALYLIAEAIGRRAIWAPATT